MTFFDSESGNIDNEAFSSNALSFVVPDDSPFSSSFLDDNDDDIDDDDNDEGPIDIVGIGDGDDTCGADTSTSALPDSSSFACSILDDNKGNEDDDGRPWLAILGF